MRFLLPELEVRPRPMGGGRGGRVRLRHGQVKPSSGLLQARRTVLLIYSTRGP